MKIEANLTPELVEEINKLSKDNMAEGYVEKLNEIKNYFIINWDEFPDNSDEEIKRFLIEICYMQQTFMYFVQSKKGGAQ